MKLIQIALLLLNIVRWIMQQIDQQKWVQAGMDKAFNEQLAIIRKHIEDAQAVKEKVSKMSDKQKEDILTND